MNRPTPPRAHDYGLTSEWDAAGNGDPAYHRDEAQESFKGAALSLVFLVPGLVLTSFPAIRWWGVLTLVALGLFGGFMCVNLMAIGVAEVRRSKMLRDPAVAEAARRYHAAIARWKQELPPADDEPVALTLEHARDIMQEYTRQLPGAGELPSPVCRPVSQLPFPKALIQEAFLLLAPYVSEEVEVEFRASYAQLAYFVPDEEFVRVDEAFRQAEERTQAGEHDSGPVFVPRIHQYALERDAEWQHLLKEIHAAAAERRRG